MTDPGIEPGESVWRTVSAGTNHKLHTRPHCPALQQSSQVMETTLQCHPDPDWCRICTGDGARGRRWLTRDLPTRQIDRRGPRGGER